MLRGVEHRSWYADLPLKLPWRPELDERPRVVRMPAQRSGPGSALADAHASVDPCHSPLPSVRPLPMLRYTS